MLMLLVILSGLVMTGLGIYTLVLFFREPKPLASDYRLGIYAAVFLLVIEVLIIAIYPAILEVLPHPGMVVLQTAIAALKVFVCTVVGIKLCRQAGLRWSMFDDPTPRRWRKSLSIVIGGVTLLSLYSYYFLIWLQPSIGVGFEQVASGAEPGIRDRIITALGLFEYALIEEIIYRGCITLVVYRALRIERYRYLMSAIIVTSLWTVAHAFSLDPAWVKFVQIIPLGLFCAWLMHRFGIEHAILAHGIFNVVFALVEMDLPLGME